MTAPEFERGAYVFFDYETQWQQRAMEQRNCQDMNTQPEMQWYFLDFA